MRRSRGQGRGSGQSPQEVKFDKWISQRFEEWPLGKLQPHPENPNVANVAILEESLDSHGFYGALIVQESTGFVLAGNHRLAALKAKGAEKVPVLVLDVDDEEALRILRVDNESTRQGSNNQARLRVILERLSETGRGLLGTGHTKKGLESLIQQMEKEKSGNGSDASRLAQANVDIREPKFLPEEGSVWEIDGLHILAVMDVMTGHEGWSKFIHGRNDSIFLPYPGPFAAVSEVAGEYRLVMIQPDTYIAGHILEQFENQMGEGKIVLIEGGEA